MISKEIMKFAANLTTMFQEKGPILARYEAAARAGFKYVESAGETFSCDAQLLKEQKEKCGLVQALINAPTGRGVSEDKGYACLPNKSMEFKESIEISINYARTLTCDKIHVMAGRKSGEFSSQQMERSYRSNIEYAAQRLADENITCLIEPINAQTVPDYFLNSYEQALDNYLHIPNVKLQMDIFHMQIICGNLTANISKYLPYTGHVQIAQVPDRGEPDSAGEINFEYIFGLLEKNRYDGYIGCEYMPKTDTVKGLKWFDSYK